MILAASGVSSVVAVDNQLLLTPRSAAGLGGGLNYHFDQLPVGIYRLGAAQAALQQYVRDGIQITAGFSAEGDIQMTVGAQNETVTVSAESPVLDTTSYHGFHERRRQSRGRRNPSNPHHASVASTAIQQRTFDLLGVPLRLA